MTMISWTEGIAAGNGYDNVTGDAKSATAVRGDLGVAFVEAGGGETGGFGYTKVDQTDQFDTAIGLDVEVGGGLDGVIGGRAKFAFKNKCSVSSASTFCIIQTNMKSAFKQIKDPRLDTEAWDLIATGKMDRFRERFGDLWVSGYYTGVEFYGVVRIEAISKVRELEIAADVEASYACMAEGSASFNFKSGMSSKEHELSIVTYQQGGKVGTASTLEEMLQACQRALAEGRSGSASPFGVSVDPYSELKLPIDDASFMEIEQARLELKRLKKNAESLRDYQNQIDTVLRHQEWYAGLDDAKIAQLNTTNQDLAHVLQKTIELATKITKDPKVVKEGSTAIPPVPNMTGVLPPRVTKNSSSDESTKSGLERPFYSKVSDIRKNYSLAEIFNQQKAKK